MNVEATARPNMPMQLTPLRGPEIGAFLTVSSGLSVFRSIGGGATDGQTVGRQPSNHYQVGYDLFRRTHDIWHLSALCL